MPLLDAIFMAGAIGAAVAWFGLSAYVVIVQRRRAAARDTMSAAIATLRTEEAAEVPLAERVDHLRPLVAQATRESIMRAATDSDTPRHAAEALTAYLVERWGLDALEREAASHRTPRDKWRRITALRILFQADRARDLHLLERALEEKDADVASVALALLGAATDPAAAELLIDALKVRRQPRSRVAVQLDRSPQHLAARLRPLLTDDDPPVRRWAATLLGRYRDVVGLEDDLASAADDADPRVRRAVVESLGRIGTSVAADHARHMLNDPIPSVRAAAAGAIGDLDRDDLAADVAVLLGDRDWWVRLAAKECLERLGPDIWPVLVRLLDDRDRFVRNGAAEVFQNLGLLDSFIVMEAATDRPAAGKIDLLRRIVAAGELRMTDSLFERVGPALAPRIRHLLSDVGLRHLGAA